MGSSGIIGRMSVCYDLHSHSTASDGTLTPAELVKRAAVAGVGVLALTDHDTLDGYPEARDEASKHALSLLAGVEISVTWRRMTIHVLGLNLDSANQTLLQGLQGLQKFRVWRAEEIARRLQKKGIDGALQGARRLCRGNIVSRTHFARFLVQSGHAASVPDVFRRFLVKGKPGYVGGQWSSMEEALGWIRDAGGIAAIAHPARYRLSRSKLGTLVKDFKALGGEGLEVVSGSHNRDETLHMAAVAHEHHLYASCGSDFHSPDQSWVELGRLRPLPEGCVPIWQSEAFA